MQLTQKLIDFCLNTTYDSIPPEVIKVQKAAFIDALSVMVAATRLEPACRKVIDYAKKYSCEGGSTLLATESKVSAPMAALGNGALAHALDFEDSHDTAFVHSNAVSIPALLAVAEEKGQISGKELLTAMVIASEITCRLSMSVNNDLLFYGWYMPPVHGAVGTVFAIGKLLGLDREQMLDAVAILMNSFTCSGEVVNSKVSVVRLIRDGFAAKAAVEATLMAREGVRARFDTPLEGKQGYFAAYTRNDYNLEKGFSELGTVWESGRISFKPWPCCRATHTTIGALKEILKNPAVCLENIEEIHICCSDVLRMVLEEHEVKYHPQSVMNAKMSIPYAVGVLLAEGEITMASFSEKNLSNPDIRKGAELVTYEIDHSLERDHAQRVIMTVRLKDGTQFRETVEHALGSLEHPMTERDVYKKYIDCMKFSQKERTVKNKEAIYEILKQIDQCEDIGALMNYL